MERILVRNLPQNGHAALRDLTDPVHRHVRDRMTMAEIERGVFRKEQSEPLKSVCGMC